MELTHKYSRGHLRQLIDTQYGPMSISDWMRNEVERIRRAGGYAKVARKDGLQWIEVGGAKDL